MRSGDAKLTGAKQANPLEHLRTLPLLRLLGIFVVYNITALHKAHRSALQPSASRETRLTEQEGIAGTVI